MSITVVLDGAGLHAWAERVPPRALLAIMEVLRRRGAGHVVTASIVTIEALTGSRRDARLDRALKEIDVEERLPLAHARTAARLRQGTAASAADAVLAETALRTRADYLVTSDPDDMTALFGGARTGPTIVTV